MWKPGKKERLAAWEMYVELITRISVVRLKPDEGLLREALSSLYTMFDTTRKILRRHGPAIAQPKGEGNLSFGHIAVAILNLVLRPVLAKWHVLLLDHESKREKGVSPVDHEKRWDKHEELRDALNDITDVVLQYAGYLAEVARVPSLIPEGSDQDIGGVREVN